MTDNLVHATCVAVEGPAGLQGILLRGASGAGKSDLALRLIDQGARLVADDQCALSLGPGDSLVARAPETISGQIEVRGLGIVEAPPLSEAAVALIVDLVPGGPIERMPEASDETLLGVTVHRLTLDPFEASALPKLRLALQGQREAAASSSPAKSSAEPKAGSTSGRNGKVGGRRRIVLVTGLSGAGHSTALKVLEDIGYEAIDNLPLSLLDAVVFEADSARPLAVGVDIRTRRFAAQTVIDHWQRLSSDPDLAVTLVFLDCADDVLERRFTETRRRHPLARDRHVAEGISAERAMTAPLKARADLALDTSVLPPGELGRILTGHFGLGPNAAMSVFVTSFSFRHGVPREADLVFDVRFSANPHYDPDLRPFDGRDPKIAAFVEQDPEFDGFMTRLTGLLSPLLPRYEREGKSYLTIAVGCTGGRHRSVLVAERLGAWMKAQDRRAAINHRDLGRKPFG